MLSVIMFVLQTDEPKWQKPHFLFEFNAPHQLLRMPIDAPYDMRKSEL